MSRPVGWESRLCAAVEVYRARPFTWGSADCALFAASCIEAVTGVDPAAAVRGEYTDAAGAMRALVGLGFSNMVEAVAANRPEVPVALAHRGDVAVVREPSEGDPLGAVGVVLGPMIAAYGQTGLHFLPRSAALRCFQVE